MKQQIKCPHCNKLFPIEDSLKHEAQELRKKLQSEEQKKSKERQRVLEQQFSDKLEKQNLAHEKELEKIKDAASKKIKDDVFFHYLLMPSRMMIMLAVGLKKLIT